MDYQLTPEDIAYAKTKLQIGGYVMNGDRPVATIHERQRNIGIIESIDWENGLITAYHGWSKKNYRKEAIFIHHISEVLNIPSKSKQQPTKPTMEINTIQFWDLQSPVRGKSLYLDKGVIYRRTQSSMAWMLRLPERMKAAYANGFKYLQVASNSLTGEIFFVLSKSKGLEIKHQSGSKTGIVVSNKMLITRLESELGLPKDGGGILDFSDNLDRKDGYTFRVTKSKE